MRKQNRNHNGAALGGAPAPGVVVSAVVPRRLDRPCARNPLCRVMAPLHLKCLDPKFGTRQY
eukprot:15337308-Heterocapsa_arctica.AAC.1